MNHLNIDIETYSSVSIGDAGLYKYAQSEDFEILLFAYSLNNGPVEVVDLTAGHEIPKEIVSLLNDPTCIKHAYNAAFEWWCLNQAGYITDIKQWQCTMVQGMYVGYPAGLDAIGKALKLEQDKAKQSTGKALIKYFCVPCKETKVNGGRTRNLSRHDPEKWNLFIEYCRQDVIAEMEILRRLGRFQLPAKEQELWHIDMKINVTGVKIDKSLVESALYIDNIVAEQLKTEAKEITGLDNPNSSAQLKKWLEVEGLEVDNLKKDTVAQLVDTVSGKVKRVLEIRKELNKTSTKKYVTMIEALGWYGRIRGLLQFYGASRTGRWAGRLVQVHNLPRNYLSTLNLARELVLKREIFTIELVYGSVADTLSQLIRTAFIPEDGKKFIIADFSAIEARVIAWLAKEQWRLDVFATHGKIYEASASQMFSVPLEKIVKGNPEYELRQKGKTAELALGYQGGKGALIKMQALENGLTEEELPDIVNRWRAANPKIVRLWKSIENAAIHVIETAQAVISNGIVFTREGDLANGLDFLTITLPSKRKLYYVNPGIGENAWGNKKITYRGINQTTKKWEWQDSYGGKLVENIVQAIARDCLAESLLRVEKAGYKTVMHIHDEIVVEAEESVTVKEICDIMGQKIEWAPGLILKAEGFETGYYMKD